MAETNKISKINIIKIEYVIGIVISYASLGLWTEANFFEC